LAEETERFKGYGDRLEIDDQPYRFSINAGRKRLARMVVCAPANGIVTASQWIRALVETYSVANTVEQILDDLPAFKKTAEEEGGHTAELVSMLDRPGGDLHAFSALLKRVVTRRLN
jgi:hypothetical protein